MNRCAVLMIGLMFPCAAAAMDFTAGALQIGNPWALPPPPGAPSMAGYLAITNTGDTDDRLLGATAAFADRVEIHETRVDGDVARMRKLDDGVLVRAGATVLLEPNGAHLMLIDPEPVSKGEQRTLTLEFERQGPVDVQLMVARPDEVSGAPAKDHDDAMPHGDSTTSDE